MAVRLDALVLRVAEVSRTCPHVHISDGNGAACVRGALHVRTACGRMSSGQQACGSWPAGQMAVATRQKSTARRLVSAISGHRAEVARYIGAGT